MGEAAAPQRNKRGKGHPRGHSGSRLAVGRSLSPSVRLGPPHAAASCFTAGPCDLSPLAHCPSRVSQGGAVTPCTLICSPPAFQTLLPCTAPHRPPRPGKTGPPEGSSLSAWSSGRGGGWGMGTPLQGALPFCPSPLHFKAWSEPLNRAPACQRSGKDLQVLRNCQHPPCHRLTKLRTCQHPHACSARSHQGRGVTGQS